MTDKLKPTAEQIQRACDMLPVSWNPSSYGLRGYCSLTAIADTIAELDAQKQISADTLARAEKAEADLRRVDEHLNKRDRHTRDLHQSAAIAAPYRVETDPLVEALMAIDSGGSQSWAEAAAPRIRAELAKRGVTVGDQTDAK